MSLDCKLPNHRRPGNFLGLHIAKSQSEPGNSLGGVFSVAEILANYRKNQVISLNCICSVVQILPNHRKNWVISLDCVCSVAEILPNHWKNQVISLDCVSSVAENIAKSQKELGPFSRLRLLCGGEIAKSLKKPVLYISLDCVCSVAEILPNLRKNWVISLDCVSSVAGDILPIPERTWWFLNSASPLTWRYCQIIERTETCL